MPLLQRALLVVLTSVLAVSLCLGAQSAKGVTLKGAVSRVVDGDTIKVRTGGFETTVRLVGIDTPEVFGGRECFGPEASARTKRLLRPGRAVRLVSDPTQDTRDRYGRLLAYVYVGRNRGLRSVNYSLVRSGHAEAYVYRASRPFRYARQYQRAEATAKRVRRGMWRRCAESGGGGGSPGDGGTNPGGSGSGGCDPNYAGSCVPLVSRDLDCADIKGPVRVVGTDRHRFDGDGDGVGCEG